MKFTILSPTAILGYGFPEGSFQRGLEFCPDLIAVDGGSSDPGPHYLGSGKSFTDRSGVKRDLRIILKAAIPQRIPVVIGTAGGSGARPHLDWTREILHEIAREEELPFTVAVVASDFDKEYLQERLNQGDFVPLEFDGSLNSQTLEETPWVVGQLGVESFLPALESGAQVILAGRAYDPAVFASLPISRGFDKALALHLGKILECAAIAASPGSGSDCALGVLYADSFELIPLNDERNFTTESVAAHSLYEKSDPFHLPGPGGTLDLENCRFRNLGRGRVEVRGTRYLPADSYTLKLEGARRVGYRTISIAGIRDPRMIADLDSILTKVQGRADMILEKEGVGGQVWFHAYGRDGVMGALEPLAKKTIPYEVGLVIDAVAPTQEEANTRCSVIRSTLLHYGYPGRISTAGNLAFPFSPSDLGAGEVYEFSVYHLLEVTKEDLPGLFPFVIETYGGTK